MHVNLYTANHKSCFHPYNTFLDDMAQIAPKIIKQYLNSAEKEDTNHFMIGLFRMWAQLTCRYSYSLAQINVHAFVNPELLGLHMTKHWVISYLGIKR